MDKTMQIQLQIRQNADEISNALKDVKSWEKVVKTKDLQRKKQQDQKKKAFPSRNGGTVPLRSFASPPSLSGAYPTSILTPATIAVGVPQGLEGRQSVPKAIGVYEEKNMEEIERERGNAEFKGGNFSAAVKSYTKCLGLKKNNFVAFSNRAMAYLKLKEFHRAVLDCNCALSIEPDHVKSLLRRATALNAMGKHRAALRDLLQGQLVEPTNQQIKQDLLQTREFLRNAVNRAPVIPVSSFDLFVHEFIHQSSFAVTADEVENGEGKLPCEPELIQGPDLPSDFRLNSLTIAPSLKSEGSADASSFLKREEESLQAEAELTSHTIESISNQVKIDIVDSEHEERTEEQKGLSKSKVSRKFSSAPINTSTANSRKKKLSSASDLLPKSSYELEKLLSRNHANAAPLQELFNPVYRKDVIRLLKNCFEPNILSLFLRALYADYQENLKSTALAASGQELRRFLFQYYQEISELSNFEMLYSLLPLTEKAEIEEQVAQSLALIRNSNLIGFEECEAVRRKYRP